MTTLTTTDERATHLTTVESDGRWQPTRAGLIGLWRYWDETFTFHQGRLLLRGPNGSGKSMALELLLPFLLDGDSSPARLTSSAKPRGRLFDRAMTGSDDASRTGFAWVEFRRGHDVFTVGARIRATRATGKADVDLFTTTLAAGRDLRLLDDTRTPLSRKALVEAIGATGRVHASADEHRAAVREVLFPGFSAARYSSVISALLALRKEKLSQNLDLEKLSAVLSDALPPLDDHDLATVAEGFERLDRRRAELAALERDLAEVRQLARQQREYARAVVVGTAVAVRSAETARDAVTRTERTARGQLAEAQTGAAAAAAERQRLEERFAAIGVEIEAYKDSQAYREGAGLADLRAQARRLRELAQRAADDAAARAAEHDRASTDLATASDERETATANLELADRELAAAAESCAAEGVAREAATIAEPDDAERLIVSWIGAARSRIAEVRGALKRHADAITKRDLRAEQVSIDEATVDERLAAQQAASDGARAELDRYGTAVRQWASGCEAVRSDRLAARLSAQPAPHHPSTVGDIVAAVTAELREQEGTDRQALSHERAGATRERAALSTERARWADGGLVDPAAPDWRSSRADLPGAPLWHLVDVRPDSAATEVDAVEAAMAAAGLLDAWVAPDGRLDLGPERADLLLTAHPVTTRTLASVLQPTNGTGTEADVVGAVLSSIPLVDSALEGALPGAPTVAIAVDGTFRLGNAAGRGRLQPARYLGAVARERHRLARLAELDILIGEVDGRLAGFDRQRAALDRWRAAVDAELASVPSGRAVLDAERAAEQAAVRLDEARRRLDEARETHRRAEEAVRGALRDLTALAARHGLPADDAGLTQIETAITRLTGTAATWARRRRERRRAEQHHDRATRDEASAANAARRARENQAAAAQEATSCEQRVAALDSSIGAEYADITRRIEQLAAERSANRTRSRESADDERRLGEAVGELHASVRTAAQAREQVEAAREQAHTRLVAAFATLADDAEIEPAGPLDTPTAVLATARAVAGTHERVDAGQQAIDRLSQRVGERVYAAQALLGARIDIDREQTDDSWWLLRTRAGGLRRRIGELSAALAGQLEQGRAELLADEERLFEQTLAGSVRQALAERIRQANALVDGINAQLAAVRTVAAGVQVRLRWDVGPDQPAVVKAARTLLLRDPADLSSQERASLQDFVRARVDQARAELELNAPWEARLRESLDYRGWHRFTLQLAHRDWDGFQPATVRRLRTLSTGERSMALHLPMIASVTAHYADRAGEPSACPRLILLDELFAGVDAANRAQLFGTFTTWQLDAVFTSDHEWCQYAELDGIAIHHLHPPSGDEPVTSTRFTWDGRRRVIDPVT